MGNIKEDVRQKILEQLSQDNSERNNVKAKNQ